MASTLQIRGVPDEIQDAVRVRAAQAGLSISDYLLSVVGEVVSRPTMAEVVKRAQEFAVGGDGADPADVIAVLRQARDR